MTTRWQLQSRPPVGADLIGIPRALHDRPGLVSLVTAQEGVVSRRQLHECGVDRRELDDALASRVWQGIGRSVVLHNAPLTEHQRQWVAVLMLDKPCALAGLSGATNAGLHGFDPEQVHLVVAHDSHVAIPSWVKLHESRRFSAADIVRPSRGAPRTSAARSLLDAATWSMFPRRAASILCAGVQQRLVRATDLERELARAGSVRHAVLLRTLLGDIGGGGHTLAEIDLGPLAKRAGLPPPVRQAPRREPNGKVRYVDAAFVLPDGTILVVEIDGAVHLDPLVADDDQDRQNEIVICRNPILRFSSLTVRLRPDRVVDQLRRMRLAYS